MIKAKNLIFKRTLARTIDMMVVGLVLAILTKVTGQAGLELVGAVILYQGLVIYCKGNSLGKEVLKIYVAPKGRYPKVMMFVRELLLWLLLPLVILSLPFTLAPLHDRLTNITVQGHG